MWHTAFLVIWAAAGTAQDVRADDELRFRSIPSQLRERLLQEVEGVGAESLTDLAIGICFEIDTFLPASMQMRGGGRVDIYLDTTLEESFMSRRTRRLIELLDAMPREDAARNARSLFAIALQQQRSALGAGASESIEIAAEAPLDANPAKRDSRGGPSWLWGVAATLFLQARYGGVEAVRTSLDDLSRLNAELERRTKRDDLLQRIHDEFRVPNDVTLINVLEAVSEPS